MLLPIALMAMATATDLLLPESHPARKIADAVGTPVTAMLISVLAAFRVFGTARGFGRAAILELCEQSLLPIASILLVVGAGGGFSKVLMASGVGAALADMARQTMLSPLILGWLGAAMIRVATGSATVAITTAAGMMAPLAANTAGLHVELLVIAMGAGSLFFSHVNDSGFWLVKEYLGLSVTGTLKSWTVMETVLSVASLLFVLLVNRLLP
jgi:GntP family gluconate:H+ symporter